MLLFTVQQRKAGASESANNNKGKKASEPKSKKASGKGSAK